MSEKFNEFNLPDYTDAVFHVDADETARTEAVVINEHFDRLVIEYPPSRLVKNGLIEWAIEDSREELASQQLHSEKFGYEVARDALLWLHYRNADLEHLIDDTKQAQEEGLTIPDEFEPGPIETYRDLQERSQARIAEGDPVTFHLFAQLEELRESRLRDGATDDDLDPREMEQVFAYTLIMKKLDQILEEGQANPDNNSVVRQLSVRRDPTDLYSTMGCSVERIEVGEDRTYTLFLFSPKQEVTEYTIIETPEFIKTILESHGEQPILNEFDLAQMLTADGDYSTQRASSPVKEIAGRI